MTLVEGRDGDWGEVPVLLLSPAVPEARAALQLCSSLVARSSCGSCDVPGRRGRG